MKSYSTQIQLNHPSSLVFKAITHELGNWWGPQDNLINAAGDIFKVSWGEPWYAFEVKEYIKDKYVLWHCIDANQIIDGLEGVQKEWVGTTLHWNLKEISNNTCELHFLHQGLVPEFICYDFCSSTWDRFLLHGLKEYLASQ